MLTLLLGILLINAGCNLPFSVLPSMSSVPRQEIRAIETLPAPTASPTLNFKPQRVTATKTPVPPLLPSPSSPPSPQFSDQSLVLMLDDGANWHVMVKEVEGEVLFEWHSDEMIHPASVVKIALGMLVFRLLEQQGGESWESALDMGPAGAGRSYRQLLRAMLVYSEEEATEILEQDVLARVTSQEVQQIFSAWGAPSIQFRPRRASVRDLSTLFECLYIRKCISTTASEQMLEWLSEETAGDQGRLWSIKPFLSTGSRIYNKRGSMTIPLTVGDCGIIETPETSPLLICMIAQSQGEPNFDQLHLKTGEFVQQVWALWKDYREIRDE
ncbi:MAG: serine hydrolase [Anaerolinea sp.]